MQEWTIHAEAAGDVASPIALDLVGSFLEHLTEYGGTAAGGGNGYDATFTVTAPTVTSAAAVGAKVFATAARAAGLPTLPVVHLEVETVEETDRKLAIPDVELVGIAEIADILGVNRQRASMLQTRQGFPPPAARLRAGPVWMLRDIDAFRDTWTRAPGRPRKTVDA